MAASNLASPSPLEAALARDLADALLADELGGVGVDGETPPPACSVEPFVRDVLASRLEVPVFTVRVDASDAADEGLEAKLDERWESDREDAGFAQPPLASVLRAVASAGPLRAVSVRPLLLGRARGGRGWHPSTDDVGDVERSVLSLAQQECAHATVVGLAGDACAVLGALGAVGVDGSARRAESKVRLTTV